MNQTIVEIATLVTVFSALLAAIYPGPEDKLYGVWDVLLAAGVIVFCLHFRSDLKTSPVFLVYATVGVSIAVMLILLTICQAISTNLVKKSISQSCESLMVSS